MSRRERFRPAVLALALVSALAAAACSGDAQEADRPAPAGESERATSWPNEENTGATGPYRVIQGRTLTRDGAVLENVQIEGTLTIRANNVTLRNVLVRANSYYGILIYGTGTVIEDSTVTGTNPDTMAGIAAIEGGTFTASRIEVVGVEDGVRLADDCVLRDSLIHGLAGDPTSHFDGATADGGFRRWRIIHNTILNPHDQTAAVWVGDARYGPSEGELRDNYLAGGGYSIYAGPGIGKGIRVVDNVFSTRYYPRSGYWGVSSRWEPEGNTWTGNTWVDGPDSGSPVLP